MSELDYRDIRMTQVKQEVKQRVGCVTIKLYVVVDYITYMSGVKFDVIFHPMLGNSTLCI